MSISPATLATPVATGAPPVPTVALPADVEAAGIPTRLTGWTSSRPRVPATVWAVLDQALFSASNWLMHVLLARRLSSADEYGAFGVAFSWSLLIGTVHIALVIEPMLVFATTRHGGRVGRYVGALTLATGALTAAGAVALSLLAAWHYATGDVLVARAMLWMAAATPCVLLLWLMRRACYARLAPARAAAAGVAYAVLMVGGLEVLHLNDLLTVGSAAMVLAGSSLVTALALAAREGVTLPTSRRDPVVTALASDHWRYGRWALATGLLTFIPAHLYFFLLPHATGAGASVGDAGVLRALSMPFFPMIQFTAAVQGLLVAVLAGQRGEPSRFARTAWGAAALLGGGAAVAWLTMGLAARPVLRLLYGERYVPYAPLMWVLGLVPIFGCLAAVIYATMAARERPDRAFVSTAIAAVFALTVGVAGTFAYGLRGAVIASAAGAAVHLGLLAAASGLARTTGRSPGERHASSGGAA